MRRKRYRALWVIVPALATLACQKPKESTSINMPPTEASDARNELAEFFANHQDQGMIHDRSIADIHFVPGAADLSGTGEARLARYAELFAESGGTLKYDTRLRDETLVNGRLGSARKFLAEYNVGGPQIQVALGMASGRGMNHFEAAAGRGVAEQPEPRGTAYRLSGGGGESGGD